MSPQISIFPTRDALMHAAAEQVVNQSVQAIAQHGRWTWALSGGSTPKALYELLASDAYRQRIDWHNTHVFWGDERCVPPDDEQSNYRMAKLAMLDHVPIPADHIHRMRGELAPETAAHLYAREIRAAFDLDAGQFPTFDTIMLGMGPDGHTASLFPDSDILERHEAIVAETWVAKFKQYRISLTFNAINHATHTVFLVAGADKAPVVKAILHDQQTHYPAARIKQATWLLDAEAAAEMKHEKTRIADSLSPNNS